MAQNYKVYCNSRLIYIGRAKDLPARKGETLKRIAAGDVKNEWKRFAAGKKQKELKLPGDPAKVWKEFKKLFRMISAAGGLVKNSNGKYLLIYRNGKWDLPKGKQDKGEAIRTTAVREVEEECGIGRLTITGRLPDTYHIYDLKGKAALKKTHWYAMKTTSDKKPVPQKEEGIKTAVWLSPAAIKRRKKNIYPSVWQLLKDLK